MMLSTTEPTANANPPSKRSRAGCDECRRRHWKCNEAKPACAFCQSVDQSCVYSLQFSWGGRPFKKSRFGKCLDQGVRAVSISVLGHPTRTRDIVYTCSLAKPNQSSNPVPNSQSASSDKTQGSSFKEVQKPDPQGAGNALSTEDANAGLVCCSPMTMPGPASLSITPTVPEESRPLLNHFVHATTMSISCHKGIQYEMCATIVPMALQVPHLLSAVFALAAAHRQSAGVVQGHGQLERMKGKSLQQLRSALSQFTSAEGDQVLATTLILCMAEVISPPSSNSAWRSHLYGASTLSAQHSIHDASVSNSTSSFLTRQYRALQAIALACGSKSYDAHVLPFPGAHIDDLAGYSTELLPIFQEINQLDRIRELADPKFVCDMAAGPPHFDCNSPLEHRSHLLFDRIEALLVTRKTSRGQHRTEEALPSVVHQDLYRLDEAYHHMASLQVFRRGSLSVPLQLIQEKRRSILACLAAIQYQVGPCPAVAALPPLFVAGTLCTSDSDRKLVRGLLKTMWINYGMGNVRSCRTILESCWKQQDDTSAHSISAHRQDGMEFCLRDMSALAGAVVEYDILPY